MKNKILTAAAVVGLALSGFAALPSYKTFSTAGIGSATPTIPQLNIPEDANSQIRVLNVSYTSDTNNGTITFSSGSTAFVVYPTNSTTKPYAATSVTNVVNSTNGLSPSAVLALNHGGTIYTNTISSWDSVGVNSNYIILPSGGWGVAPSVGDSIYVMGQAPVTRYVGAGTNQIDGEAVYVGNYGRPVTITMSPGLVTNRLAVTVHYDSQSN